MLIDCDTCSARGDACSDCVLSVLLAPPPVVEWDEDERRALALLADAGLLPRLRLVSPLDVVPTAGPAAEQIVPAEPAAPSQQAIPLGEPFTPGPRQRTRPARRPDAAGPGRRPRRAG
ncbi:hypothetical protein [Pseudofrankia sp. DC12]|uniref:hypothetical protein n=1 Tax=Pseudofrankia sp. DC12 TaxID=683315 RepID=UPI0005F7AD64|nr:hypothetical protein [Pseudofrankia sp. DC12]